MRTKDFDYTFPEELIAQKPLENRDASRLMVLNKNSHKITHSKIINLLDHLNKEDLIIFNNSKVIPARLYGFRESGGGHEVLLTKALDKLEYSKTWEALLTHTRRVKIGSVIHFGKGLNAKCVNRVDDKIIIEFNKEGEELKNIISILGKMPLPPYINRKPNEEDVHRYQTIYANKIGSVAAPTAGLHFSENLLNKIKNSGTNIDYVTLHVSADTFLPVRSENITDHEIHGEWVEVSDNVANKINETKRRGGRIIAVGTTTVRTLESSIDENGLCVPSSKETKLFITPGYKFKIVDAIITNFHRPESTLLALVSAFAGRDFIMSAYKEAIKEKYRLFSYGDAMLII